VSALLAGAFFASQLACWGGAGRVLGVLFPEGGGHAVVCGGLCGVRCPSEGPAEGLALSWVEQLAPNGPTSGLR